MDKLKMHTPNLADENYKKLAALFPNAVTEVIVGYESELDENGQEKVGFDGKVVMKPIVERAIDKDVLMQEISAHVVEGREERYQFTWPDKKKAMLAANAPISATLRPVQADSVGKDGTPGGWDSENLYIEGDNLDVLKLLQETYLGKVKMIYIDPPYNTGNDFVYEDDFAEDVDSYLERSGQFDDQGNRLEQNTESNGRFHTDWLNMIYPRLKLAKNLLSDDGVIFISIDDNELANLLKLCSSNELFGESCFVAVFPWRVRTAKSDVPFGVSQDYDWIVCYAKSSRFVARITGTERQYYETPDFPGKPWRIHDLTKQTTASERPNSFFTIIDPKTGKQYPANPNRTWAITQETFEYYNSIDRIVFPGDYDFLRISKPALRYWKKDDMQKAGDGFGLMAVSTKLPDDIGMSLDGTKEITSLFGRKVFPFPKPVKLLRYLVEFTTKIDTDALILDFFSGSATTAHAVMQLNAADGGHRKFIMVQLPEKTDENSETYKAGYKNICEVGKERIRRAGRKIKEEAGMTAQDLDIGFRVLRLDSSNMQDVYYNPAAMTQTLLDITTDNIKPDRTPEDLLFQVMLDLGVDLSSPIQETTIDGKKVYAVAGTYLLACFDPGVTTETVTAIAKQRPYYAVFRDSSMANDSVATNFDQIFETYSPGTVRKVL